MAPCLIGPPLPIEGKAESTPASEKNTCYLRGSASPRLASVAPKLRRGAAMSSAKAKSVKDDIVDDGDYGDDVPGAISMPRKKSALSGSTKKSHAKQTAGKKEQPKELGNEEEEGNVEEDEEKKDKSKKKKNAVNKKEGVNEKEKEREMEPIVKKGADNKKRVCKDGKTASGENTENGEVKKKAKERKVYALPGQKHDTPEERDVLRIFYETLYQQVPTSEMAKIWMMEWGLLPSEEAAIVYEMKLKKSKGKSPVKSVSIKKTNEVPIDKMMKDITIKTETNMKKKRKTGFDCSDNDDGDDFIAPRKRIKRAK